MNFLIKNIITALGACSMLCFFILTSCDDAEKGVLNNAVYLSEASKDSEKKITIDDAGATATLTARTGDIVNNTVYVNFVRDIDLLDNYNRRNGTNYIPILEDMYEIDQQEVEIVSGSATAVTANVRIKPFTQEMIDAGEKYALPISISNVRGGISTLESAKGIIFLLDQVVVTSVPIIGRVASSTLLKAQFDMRKEDYDLATWTFEMRVNMSKLGTEIGQYNNQSIWNVAAAPGYNETQSGVFIRFGDTPIRGNVLQIKIKGGSAQLNCNTEFNTNRWYHLAFVCDGSKVSVYVDGELDSSIDIPSGNFHFGGKFTMAASNNYFVSELLASEVRFWTIPITQQQIKNNMFAVNPQSEGLEGYWKLNEGVGSIFNDATGHGNNGMATINTTDPCESISWKEGVRSDDK